MPKTNREIFQESLARKPIEDFIKDINGYGRCRRCSNYYYDWNQPKCHKNINESSCEEGQAEYMESCPGESLQEKYHKEYYECRDYGHAQILKKFTKMIFSCNIIEPAIESCGWGPCHGDCGREDCDMQGYQIVLMYRRYLGKWKTGHPRKEPPSIGEYLRAVLIPSAEDMSVQSQLLDMLDEIEAIAPLRG